MNDTPALAVSWLTLVAFSASVTLPSLARGDEAADATAQFKSLCFDSANLRVAPAAAEVPDGELRHHLYVLVAERRGAEPAVFDCAAFGVGPVPARDHPDLARAAAENPCLTGTALHELAAIATLGQDADYATQLAACGATGTHLLSGKCAAEVACDGIRAVTTLLTGGTLKMGLALYDRVRGEVELAQTGCVNPRRDDCVQKLVVGVLKDLWGNIEGIGFLAGMAWDGTKWVARKGWNGVKWAGGKIVSFFSSDDVNLFENKSSEAAHAASGESESSIREFIASPGAFIAKYATRIFNAVGDFIKTHFRESWVQWRCASCDAVVNGVCEVAGILGGEVLLAFLTGAAVNLASRSKKLAQVGVAVARVAEAAGKSRAVRIVTSVAGRAGKIILYVPEKIFRLAQKTPGLKQYLHLNERAFLAGYRLGKGAPAAAVVTGVLATGDFIPMTESVSINIVAPPPHAPPGPRQLRPGYPAHGAEAVDAHAWGQDLARVAVFERPKGYLSLEEFAEYEYASRRYKGVKNIPPRRFRVNTDGTIQINGGNGMLDGRPIAYRSAAMPPIHADATAASLLDLQFPGLRAEPLLNGKGEQVAGGFQRIFVTPTEVTQLGGKPSLLKVVDPVKARAALGAGATDAQVAEYVLSASQLDDSYFDFLSHLSRDSGHPPAFRMPARRRISPSVVEVERLDSPTLADLKRADSPLIEKCRAQLLRFAQVVGGVYMAMDLAYRKRFATSGGIRGVGSLNADGSGRFLPVGPDINHNNVKLTSDCEVQVIDQ